MIKSSASTLALEDRKERILTRSPIFRALTEPGLAEAKRVGSIVRADRRRNLGVAGDAALYVLGGGRARVVQRKSVRDITLYYLTIGDIVGETILPGRGETPEVLCLENVEAVRVPIDLIRRLLSTEANFATAMMELMAARRLIAESRFAAILTRSVEARVSEFILDAARQHGVPDDRGMLVGAKFTHQEIADYVGSTRETVTLVLGELKRAGLIETDHRRVVIIDADMLEARSR